MKTVIKIKTVIEKCKYMDRAPPDLRCNFTLNTALIKKKRKIRLDFCKVVCK